jgi:trehalose/maltose transport system permease protein
MSRPEHNQKLRLSDQTFGLLMLSPAAVFVLVVAVYPVVRILWLSFFTQNLGTGLQPQFSGTLNYVRLFKDGHYWQTMMTTTVFTFVAVGTELMLGLGFALLLNEKFHGRSVARTAVLIPWALPTAVLALAWAWIFNDLLTRLGFLSHPVAWLGSGTTAMFAVIFADVWKTTPFMMIILLAGLQNIPDDLYEAVQIDGARAWHSFRLITLPMLMPSILLALVFRIIQSFGIFDLIYVMTGGGPGGATETVAIYNYRAFLRYLDFGYGAAMIVVTFLITGAICLLIYWPLSRTREARAA